MSSADFLHANDEFKKQIFDLEFFRLDKILQNFNSYIDSLNFEIQKN